VIFKRLKKRIFSRGVLKRGAEIDPDEIFLDSSNLPEFDTHQFEGRLERGIPKGTFFWLVIVFITIGIVFSGRLYFLQITQGKAYEIRSQSNSLKQTTIFSNRGVIYDRNKIELAWNEQNLDGEFSLRTYSSMLGLGHLIGYVKYPQKDKFGVYYEHNFVAKDGAEIVYNNELSGINGLKITETDAKGKIQSEGVLTPPVDGKNITLSIDSKVSNELYKAIAQTVQDRGFMAGAGVIMDVHNGEILALVSYPEYSSNVMAKGEDVGVIKALLNNKSNPFLNRVVGGQFIPGSIVKPFISMAALTLKSIDPMKQILSTGSISVQNPYDPTKKSVFKDWRVNGWVDMRHAIAVSCDVYFYAVGGGYEDQKGIGIANIEKFTKMFGFGEDTGIDLPGEKNGNVPSIEWKKQNFPDGLWRLGDTYNSSIGQYGFQVTPIQAVRAVASLANGGTLMTPTILKDNEKNIQAIKALPLSADNFQIVREGMRLGVTEGVAKGLSMSGINVAAKTGTAELDASKSLVNSWVTGFFPYENPHYAFAVLMERGPYKNQIGATSIMRQLLEWMYANTPEYVK
jgi:penicillin-binding protein 2